MCIYNGEIYDDEFIFEGGIKSYEQQIRDEMTRMQKIKAIHRREIEI
jgi:hypothetical protein